MSIHLEMGWILTIALVSIRVGMIFVLTPIFASVRVPAQVRVLFVLALSAMLVIGMGTAKLVAPLSLAGLVSASFSEVVVGGLLAFGIFAAFGAFMLGGKIIDVQMGFGVASIVDPGTRQQASVFGVFLNMLAVVLFFAVDGHHMIIRGLAYSLEYLPPGKGVSGLNMGAIITQFGVMFIYGVALVAPALFSILLVDVGMAVTARTMPQLNVFVVALPLKIFVGLSVTAVSLDYISPLLSKVYASIFVYWNQVLG